MKVYLTDEVYRRDDGIRDPFRWARFSGTKFAIGVVLLGIVLALSSSRDPAAQARGDAIEAGSDVIGRAVGVTRDASARRGGDLDI